MGIYDTLISNVMLFASSIYLLSIIFVTHLKLTEQAEHALGTFVRHIAKSV